MKFYRCDSCQQILTFTDVTGNSPVCCATNMKELLPNTSGANPVVHIPIVKVIGNQVEVMVGQNEHPMEENHYIMWIIIVTTFGSQQRILRPHEKPRASFPLSQGEYFLKAYAYCNLHLLWENIK